MNIEVLMPTNATYGNKRCANWDTNGSSHRNLKLNVRGRSFGITFAMKVVTPSMFSHPKEY